MNFDISTLPGIVRLAIGVLAALLGLFVLWRGRRLPWLFSGAAALLLGILAVRILDRLLGGSLSDAEGLNWGDGIPIIAAVVGVLAGMYRRDVADALIGLSTGGVLALWFARLTQPDDVALTFWSALVILLAMALGLLFVIRFHEVALILLSAIIGPGLVVRGLSLPLDSELVASLALALAIAGLVIQYHDYLVELRLAHRLESEGLASPPASAQDEAGTLSAPAG